jgi:para-nitrobenzyl esterase
MKEPTMKNNEKANHRLEHYGLTAKLLLGVAAICVVMLSTVLTASADSSSQSPTALTESGVVIGSMMNGVNEFLGIPYAAPPVGDRRWTPPISYGKFQGSTLQATQFGSECTQPGGIGSEDCLFLNVYRPQSDSGHGGEHGLPVMVWFPGGGLTTGSWSNPDIASATATNLTGSP